MSAAVLDSRWIALAALGSMLLLLGGCRDDRSALPPGAAESLATLDGSRIRAADDEPHNWLSHGRTYDEQRFSPLDQIDTDTVGRLGLAWHFDLGVDGRCEATPIVVDGVLYVTARWSVVYALDARTGRLLWRYDPGLAPPPDGGDASARVPSLCCGPVNRGVAAWKGRIYVGMLDGRLEALDARTGRVVWSQQTTDPARPYSITGAPRVVRGKVIIGNGGADFGVRGYVSAYDAETGALLWRFHTVPDPKVDDWNEGFLREAAKTWDGGGEWRETGGGGTVWDSISYDPVSNLLYVGVGNGSPLNRYRRNPAGGDNLFLASIVALDADTGKYVWHFQTTPWEGWDYTATQQMILADLEIDRRRRQVLMQAPKNGFFYVLDRKTGAFLSAKPFAAVNWAVGVDPVTGRPIEAPEADYRRRPQHHYPSPTGAHNWHPMAFSPQTGLVYMPVREEYGVVRNRPSGSAPIPRAVREALERDGRPFAPSARLSAWDPVAQTERWRVEHPWLGNGGVLATAGRLVFQGTADGVFAAYRADDGTALWRVRAQTGIVAAPVSYALDGRQYVAVVAGHVGGVTEIDGEPQRVRSERPLGRVLSFALDATETLPAIPWRGPPPPPPPSSASDDVVALGEQLYSGHCARCHGNDAVSLSPNPDLRYMSAETHREFAAIVLAGSRSEQGMPRFRGRLDARETEAIQAYLVRRATETR